MLMPFCIVLKRHRTRWTLVSKGQLVLAWNAWKLRMDAKKVLLLPVNVLVCLHSKFEVIYLINNTTLSVIDRWRGLFRPCHLCISQAGNMSIYLATLFLALRRKSKSS